MSNEIDWTKPLEAYHPDGAVLPYEGTFCGPDHDGDYFFEPDPVGQYQYGRYFHADGTDEDGSKWRLRNRTEKPALTEEMVRECMREAVRGKSQYDGRFVELEAILTLLREHGVLAEPVEDDELELKHAIAKEYGIDGRQYEGLCEAIRRVRAEGAE